MGQYHNIVNLDKNFFYSPGSIANSYKLLEQGCSLTSCASLALLLSAGWNGERVLLVGDYGQDDDLEGYTANDLSDLYQGNGMRNVGWLARKVLTENVGITFHKKEFRVRGLDGSVQNFHHYENSRITEDTGKNVDDNVSLRIVNYDKREIVDPRHFGHGDTLRDLVLNGYDDGAMTALFILLVVTTKGGARGGGDSDHTLNGTWGGDRIGITAVDDIDVNEYADISRAFNIVDGFYN